jgi:hypothetical protein
VKLRGQNQSQPVFLIEQNTNQPKQAANDERADLFELVVAMTVIVCMCHTNPTFQ